MSKNIYIESLVALGGKKKEDSIDFIGSDLVVRDKDSRIEYTVVKAVKDEDGKPVVVCYRYYGPNHGSKKVFIKIPLEDFEKYEPV